MRIFISNKNKKSRNNIMDFVILLTIPEQSMPQLPGKYVGARSILSRLS